MISTIFASLWTLTWCLEKETLLSASPGPGAVLGIFTQGLNIFGGAICLCIFHVVLFGTGKIGGHAWFYGISQKSSEHVDISNRLRISSAQTFQWGQDSSACLFDLLLPSLPLRLSTSGHLSPVLVQLINLLPSTPALPSHTASHCAPAALASVLVLEHCPFSQPQGPLLTVASAGRAPPSALHQMVPFILQLSAHISSPQRGLLS